jgi:hypothetical protein
MIERGGEENGPDETILRIESTGRRLEVGHQGGPAVGQGIEAVGAIWPAIQPLAQGEPGTVEEPDVCRGWLEVERLAGVGFRLNRSISGQPRRRPFREELGLGLLGGRSL